MKLKVTVIGSGRMGSALATALLEMGLATTIWNRTRSKAEALSKLGLNIASSIGDAVREADVVIISIRDYDSTRELFERSEIGTALRGKILVQLSSGTPRDRRRCGGPRTCGISSSAARTLARMNSASVPQGNASPSCVEHHPIRS